MSPLEIKKLQLQVKQVEMAKLEMDFKISERLEEIERLKANMENQDKRVAELREMLKAVGVDA